MKKFFVIAALAASMSLVSCGGDKGNGTDSDSVANQEAVEAVTNNPEADALISKINACTSMEELQQLAMDNQAAFAALPADLQQKVDAIATEKANSFGALTEVVEEVSETVETLPGDAVEAAQNAGESLVDKAKEAGAAAVDKAKEAGAAAVDKAKEAGANAVEKAKAAGANAAKSLGL